MPSAYVLLNCELGCEAVVIDEIRTLSHVSEVNRVYGSSYDMIIKVSAETTDKLNQIISSKIRRIEKVKATQTMMVIDGQQVEKSN
ncbi:MAG TPA: Lrp/AsnC ligand binding domain-containing protein [Nitrososphaeraceae archaeon]|jgi:DNA-binding Lrp family transcriptional regulator|nr:Lrp/AsnC ligand binding domain-containing protein [Nitrososphaeraceae archaeon]